MGTTGDEACAEEIYEGDVDWQNTALTLQAEVTRLTIELASYAGFDAGASRKAEPLDRETVARAYDPDAFEDHPVEARRDFARIQWSIRRKLAVDAADRLMPLLASRKVEVTDEQDTERTARLRAYATWDSIARHPFFRSCYQADGTLHDAILAKLDAIPATVGVERRCAFSLDQWCLCDLPNGHSGLHECQRHRFTDRPLFGEVTS